MPRSVALFEHQGIEVIPAPVDYAITQAGWDNLFAFNLETTLVNLVPTVGNMSLTSSILKELIGMQVYRLRGWMD
jgi:uncharacterized SAM-binding protein YcdF (DUF218 family)